MNHPDGNPELDDEAATQEQEGGAGVQLEVIKSYLSFARRGLRKRLWAVFLIFGAGLALTLVTLKYFPRTYRCTTIMMGEANQIFGEWQPQPFIAASNLIMRHENLEELVRDTGMAKVYLERRPPLLQFKDRLMQQLFGEWSPKTIEAILVGTLETKLSVEADGSTMTINVHWSDPITAMTFAEAARKGYLETRRRNDMAAFNEKMTILEGHATKLRDEIEQAADQIQSEREAKFAKATKVAAAQASSNTGQAPPALRLSSPAPILDLAAPEKKLRLESAQKKLAEVEAEAERKLREERAKLAELKLRLAPSHPEVLTLEQRILLLSQEPSDVALLRAEVRSLQQEVQAGAAFSRNMQNLRQGPRGAGETEALPSAITELLRNDDMDPAMLAQLSGAISKYGALRDEIRSGRIQLDTAQAAFHQRYRVVVPAEAPNRPVKPNSLAILGGGLVFALFLALAFPILAELRTGIIVERWQVHMVQLPVLAELRLPPRSAS